MASILIIDDEVEFGQILGDFIKDEVAGDHSVTVLDNGVDGLRVFYRDNPDIVMCDVNINGPLQGREVLKILVTKLKSTKVIMITGDPKHTHQDLADQVDLFLEKPFNMDDIVQYLNSLTLKV